MASDAVRGKGRAKLIGQDRGWTARRALLALGCAAAAFGCAAPPPPPPPPTILEVKLSATPDANRNAAGQGAPVAVRIYQLASPAGFEGAEFYRLYRQDAATLGADVVKRDEYLLAPGSKRELQIKPADTVRALGVFAAYRDYQNATWRAVAPVPANKTTEVAIEAGQAGLSVKSTPVPPKPQ